LLGDQKWFLISKRSGGQGGPRRCFFPCVTANGRSHCVVFP
jgi:hypothetical protein